MFTDALIKLGWLNYYNGELTNPVNDSRLIKKALDSLNFEVHYFENLTTKDEVYQSVRGFVKNLDGADISFIYQENDLFISIDANVDVAGIQLNIDSPVNPENIYFIH